MLYRKIRALTLIFLANSNYSCVPTSARALRPTKKLRIRLISGHHLPKTDGKIKGNVIQPYVKIKIRGHTVDETHVTTQIVPKVNKLHLKQLLAGVRQSILPSMRNFRTASILYGKPPMNSSWSTPSSASSNFKSKLRRKTRLR